jgi:hypothetical protein
MKIAINIEVEEHEVPLATELLNTLRCGTCHAHQAPWYFGAMHAVHANYLISGPCPVRRLLTEHVKGAAAPTLTVNQVAAAPPAPAAPPLVPVPIPVPQPAPAGPPPPTKGLLAPLISGLRDVGGDTTAIDAVRSSQCISSNPAGLGQHPWQQAL